MRGRREREEAAAPDSAALLAGVSVDSAQVGTASSESRGVAHPRRTSALWPRRLLRVTGRSAAVLHCEGVCVSPAGRRRTAWHGCRRAHGPVRRGDPPARSPIYTRASTRRTTPRAAAHARDAHSAPLRAAPCRSGGPSPRVTRPARNDIREGTGSRGPAGR